MTTEQQQLFDRLHEMAKEHGAGFMTSEVLFFADLDENTEWWACDQCDYVMPNIGGCNQCPACLGELRDVS